MRYWTEGPFELVRGDDGYLNLDEYSRRSFWSDAEESTPGISEACGCYVFALRRGRTTKPWYIGKAERQSFKREALTQDKVNKYNFVLAGQQGTPLLYFYARITLGRTDWSGPSSTGYRDISFLERMLIGQALKRNKNLYNVIDTALLRAMIVPGLLNTQPGRLRQSDSELKEVFGY
jgi:hypothetical protein